MFKKPLFYPFLKPIFMWVTGPQKKKQNIVHQWTWTEHFFSSGHRGLVLQAVGGHEGSWLWCGRPPRGPEDGDHWTMKILNPWCGLHQRTKGWGWFCLDLGDFWSRWFGMNWRGVFFWKSIVLKCFQPQINSATKHLGFRSPARNTVSLFAGNDV